MTPDELRALADALDRIARTHVMIAPDESETQHRAADYLRAQADAQPVAPVALVRAYNAGYMAGHHDTVEGGFVDIHQSDMDTFHADLVAELGLTAAPQAEPCIGNDSACPCQDGDACHYKDAADGTKAWPVPLAEPIDPHMIVAEDRFPDVPAERWKPCPQCGEDFDRECPICDGLGRVLATDSEQAEPKPTPASGDDLGVYKGMADSYRNDAEPTGAPYGIIDPDYGRVYTIARKLAWEEGYAIGLHGSFTRDLDLIAVPWAERACEPEHLIRRIVEATGLKLRDGVGVKPHGRRAWTLLFPAFGDPRFVDLSVMPRIGGSDE